MIFVGKSPYRVSLLGGGSDLNWFVKEYGYGLSLGFSLDKYSYSVLNLLPSDSNYGILDYSVKEVYSSINDIAHPIIRETLKLFKINKFIEIKSFGFAGRGSGLGGSSSFLLSLLASIKEGFKMNLTYQEIIDKSCEIEIEILKKPIGKQDQYLCSEPGINSFTFQDNNNVYKNNISSEKIETLKRLVNNFYLIPTNINRKSDHILSSIQKNLDSVEKLLEIREIAENFIKSSEKRDYKIEENFHSSMRKSWLIKKTLSNVMNNNLNDQYSLIEKLIPNNWIRLIGAGSGGYFLVSSKISEDQIKSLRSNNVIKDFFKPSISNSGIESFCL